MVDTMERQAYPGRAMSDNHAKRPPGETRRLVLRLARRGITSPQAIADRLGITRQAAYGHLQRLRDAGEIDTA